MYPILTAIYFWTFLVIVYFVIFNVALAIILDAYAEVNAESRAYRLLKQEKKINKDKWWLVPGRLVLFLQDEQANNTVATYTALSFFLAIGVILYYLVLYYRTCFKLPARSASFQYIFIHEIPPMMLLCYYIIHHSYSQYSCCSSSSTYTSATLLKLYINHINHTSIYKWIAIAKQARSNVFNFPYN